MTVQALIEKGYIVVYNGKIIVTGYIIAGVFASNKKIFKVYSLA